MKACRLPLLALFVITAAALAGCATSVEMVSMEGPERLESNQSGTFSAMVNEDADQPVSYDWDFGDGSTASGASADHSFADPGTYSVTVTASNRNGKASMSESGTVVVVPPPVPAQILAVLSNNNSPDTQSAVEFSANVRGDAPLTYAWSFGEGTSSAAPQPTHTFMEAGSYTVSLEVSNVHGSDSRTLDVMVTPWEAAYCSDLAEMNAAFFERNSSVLTDAGMQALADNLDIMRECPGLHVRVEGMAGPFERNAQELSDDRARAVRDYYAENGVVASRVTTMGLGQAGGGSRKSGAEQFRRADTIPLR